MNVRILLFIFFVAATAGLVSCGGSKPIVKIPQKIDSVKTTAFPAQRFKYKFHLKTVGSMTTPRDDIYIDTNGQMIFDTQQHMKDGSWKSPHGLAYIEARDEDTLLSFIKVEALFSIDESDVSPACADGDQYLLQISRTDLKKRLSVNTNTCAGEYNLLTGEARKIYPAFLLYLNRLRDRYRPLFSD